MTRRCENSEVSCCRTATRCVDFGCVVCGGRSSAACHAGSHVALGRSRPRPPLMLGLGGGSRRLGSLRGHAPRRWPSRPSSRRCAWLSVRTAQIFAAAAASCSGPAASRSCMPSPLLALLDDDDRAQRLQRGIRFQERRATARAGRRPNWRCRDRPRIRSAGRRSSARRLGRVVAVSAAVSRQTGGERFQAWSGSISLAAAGSGGAMMRFRRRRASSRRWPQGRSGRRQRSLADFAGSAAQRCRLLSRCRMPSDAGRPARPSRWRCVSAWSASAPGFSARCGSGDSAAAVRDRRQPPARRCVGGCRRRERLVRAGACADDAAAGRGCGGELACAMAPVTESSPCSSTVTRE